MGEVVDGAVISNWHHEMPGIHTRSTVNAPDNRCRFVILSKASNERIRYFPLGVQEIGYHR
jgi:hypothetical protein